MLAALPEDLNLGPSSHMKQRTNTPNSRLQEIQHPPLASSSTHTQVACTRTRIHIKKPFLKKSLCRKKSSRQKPPVLAHPLKPHSSLLLAPFQLLLCLIYYIGSYVYVGVSTCLCVCEYVFVCVYMHVEARGQLQVSFSGAAHRACRDRAPHFRWNSPTR